MNQPITVTATVAAWLASSYSPTELLDRIARGDAIGAVEKLAFYRPVDAEAFGDWVRVGDAQVTVTLLPRDEQVSRAVAMLKQQLEQARAEWLTKQQEIMTSISKLQALEYSPEVA